MKRRTLLVLMILAMLVTTTGFFLVGHFLIEGEAEKYSITDTKYKCTEYASKSPEEIVDGLSLEQKAAQMVMPAIYNVKVKQMKANDYGSILSQDEHIDATSWRRLVDKYQNAALLSDAGIPYIAKLCHMLWNYSPCIAQSVDPRWGRTYESYGSDLKTITKLSTAYTRGLIDGGLVACAKHYFADGNVEYGTGENGDIDMLIDRGDAKLDDDEINELLKVYQAQIDAGVQTIMISHSSLNGVKMHENKEYIMKLKNEMGFDGYIASDWESIQHISCSSYRDQVITSINAGIDMLMEIQRYDEAMQIIIDAVKSGEISEERVDDAVTRIIKVKKEAGLFDDPFLEKAETKQKDTGSLEYRKVAEKLVEESLVLLKNDSNVLPIKEGTKVYITGPAADDASAQCGGWTIAWSGYSEKEIGGVTTIQDAFESYADDYGIEIITDKNKAQDADVVLLCVGEKTYAEWEGDTADLELCGALGLSENSKAIEEAKKLGKPTVTCIIAGRNVIIDPEDFDEWGSVVMCYLPGSEGKGISDVLCGCADFEGKLPSPWYGSVDQIGTDKNFLEQGYGLSYGSGFQPENEPERISD